MSIHSCESITEDINNQLSNFYISEDTVIPDVETIYLDCNSFMSEDFLVEKRKDIWEEDEFDDNEVFNSHYYRSAFKRCCVYNEGIYKEFLPMIDINNTEFMVYCLQDVIRFYHIDILTALLWKGLDVSIFTLECYRLLNILFDKKNPCKSCLLNDSKCNHIDKLVNKVVNILVFHIKKQHKEHLFNNYYSMAIYIEKK